MDIFKFISESHPSTNSAIITSIVALLAIICNLALKMFDAYWDKTSSDLHKTLDLIKKLESHDPKPKYNDLRELLELHKAKFYIRQELLKEYTTNDSYASRYEKLRKASDGRAYWFKWVFRHYRWISISPYIPLILAGVLYDEWLYCITYGITWSLCLVFLAVGVKVIGRIFILNGRFFGSHKDLQSYTANFIGNGTYEIRAEQVYNYIGLPQSGRYISIYERADKNANGSFPILRKWPHAPVSYKFIANREMTLLEIEWAARLNTLWKFGNKSSLYIPFVIEDKDTNHSGYYLIIKKLDIKTIRDSRRMIVLEIEEIEECILKKQKDYDDDTKYLHTEKESSRILGLEIDRAKLSGEDTNELKTLHSELIARTNKVLQTLEESRQKNNDMLTSLAELKEKLNNPNYILTRTISKEW